MDDEKIKNLIEEALQILQQRQEADVKQLREENEQLKSDIAWLKIDVERLQEAVRQEV
jgi:hypothetical protein